MKIRIFYTLTTSIISGIFIFARAQNATFKTLSPAEFQKLLNGKNIILLDVRTAEEVSEGKISNATNIDFYSNTFEQQISKLDKSKTVLVYCRSGKRSAGASEILAKKGFKVINLDGGITNWQAQGLPIQK